MDGQLALALLDRIGYVEPPGCQSTSVDHPNPWGRSRRAVEVGFVMEHRFAFCYWIRCCRELRRGISDDQFRPPDLVTWDWHDDVGGTCDFVESELEALDPSNEQEVALFAWAGLCQLNDGQIAPALWLNALGNVYVVQKQHRNCKDQNRTVRDRYGNEHKVYYFRSMKDFPGTFERTCSDTGVVWDVDLDYFTSGRTVADQTYTPPLGGETIRALLSPHTPWMAPILRDLKAITIALEPAYTGGLGISLELYRHWEEALFTAPLFNGRCRWREGLIET